MTQFGSAGNHAGAFTALNLVVFCLSLDPLRFGKLNCVKGEFWLVSVFSADEFTRLLAADLKKRVRARFPLFRLSGENRSSTELQSISKCRSRSQTNFLPSFDLSRFDLNKHSNSHFRSHSSNLNRSQFAAADPFALSLAATVLVVRSIVAKRRPTWKARPTRQISDIQPSRRADLDKILLESNGIFVAPNLSLTSFFVKELCYSPLWTRNAILPFVFQYFPDPPVALNSHCAMFPADPALDATQWFILAEAARLSPLRRKLEQRKWQRKQFFKNRDASLNPLHVGLPTVDANETRQVQSPALNWIVQDSSLDYISDIFRLWLSPAPEMQRPPSLSRVDTYRLIFKLVQISHYDNGCIVVQNETAEKEEFDLLRDLRYLYEPLDGDSIESVKLLFHESEAKLGFKQRVKKSWKEFKAKVARKCRRSEESEKKKSGNVAQAWNRV